MGTLTKATTIVDDAATTIASGTDTVCVWAPVARSADAVPRLYGSAAAIYDQHGYGPGVEYAAVHAERARKPMLFCGLPIATPGAVSRENTSGNTGTSVTTLAAGSDGVLVEHDGELSVVTGGTIGTDQIVLSLSLDGGLSTRTVRLGTATTYAIPYVGVTVSFAAGTLVAGNIIHTWHGTGPRSDAAGWLLARYAMAAQQRQCRSVVLCQDLQSGTEAAAFLAQMDAYETSDDRYVFGRAPVYDRAPLAALADVSHRMTSGNVTFAEVGATGDTITRSAGSFIADGFAAGDLVTIDGSASNDLTTATKIATVTASVITLDTDDLVAEGPVSGVSIVGVPSLTFAASTDTIVRSSGSWLTDGFRVGDSITIDGSASNDGTRTATAVTASTLTFASGLADEVIGTDAVTITAGQTKAAWIADIDAKFAGIDAAPRLSLSAGRARVLSPFSAWYLRQPAGHFASWREYAHDVHVSPIRKTDGPVGGTLYDGDGALVEYDDRVDGGAGSAARFTTLRTWANGPGGAFISNSLTRAIDASLLSRTNNVAVVNVAQQVCQTATEQIIGRGLTLNPDGTATRDALATVASEVNRALEQALLTNRGEGPRASSAVWTPSTDDVLNVAEPLLTGTLVLQLNGTIHSVTTRVRVLSGGAEE